jgi:hypothetical protein
MAHPLVELAANALIERPGGVALGARARLARAVDQWANERDAREAREAIGELVQFAVFISERWDALEAGRAIIEVACRATPILAARALEDDAERSSGGFGLGTTRRAPRYGEEAAFGTLPNFALLQHRVPKRRA